ncbi:TPA: hypothetical protein N0F65_006234 [Lagenidium giganteum]|uniref:Uncharacterized protein n=1 Tax=Lagenidium giganteum TaxID=4803 RepID=A0AAV2Z0U7_9STRA|nr:TPA: hypothetical protein N0F65_006234 [Lagenidium giganteum]
MKILVRPEVDDFGKQNVVIRYVSTKSHQRSQHCLSSPVQRYQETKDDGRLGCTMSLVHQLHEAVSSDIRL